LQQLLLQVQQLRSELGAGTKGSRLDPLPAALAIGIASVGIAGGWPTHPPTTRHPVRVKDASWTHAVIKGSAGPMFIVDILAPLKSY
jgi:hypothetical protein